MAFFFPWSQRNAGIEDLRRLFPLSSSLPPPCSGVFVMTDCVAQRRFSSSPFGLAFPGFLEQRNGSLLVFLALECACQFDVKGVRFVFLEFLFPAPHA